MERIVVITGMSGAGRTTCLKMLEDLGYEAVDNLPVNLLPRLTREDGTGPERLAIGVDSRTRGLAPEPLLAALGEARGAGGSCLLFLDCDDEVLRRRFTESRRRHPLADQPGVGDALAAERALMAPLRAAADFLIDTTDLALPDLRRLLAGRFGTDSIGLSLTVMSFAYRNGLPREADLVFDVRFLHNPHYVEALRPQSGKDAGVQAHIRSDPAFDPFVADLFRLLTPLLPRYRSEGKSYLTIAFGCTGGKHRSVFLADLVSRWLNDSGWETNTVHRDLERGTASGPRQGP